MTIPISLNASVSGLIVFSLLVRMLIWLYGSGRLLAFSVREREREGHRPPSAGACIVILMRDIKGIWLYGSGRLLAFSVRERESVIALHQLVLVS
jgi:hypothetical protein